jgi:hypothetical protein
VPDVPEPKAQPAAAAIESPFSAPPAAAPAAGAARDEVPGGPIPLPRVSGQPVFTVVAEEHGAARVRAFAKRWRAYLYQQERRRPWLAAHDLCASTCTGLTSRCLRLMEREGFLATIRPPAPASKQPVPPRAEQG